MKRPDQATLVTHWNVAYKVGTAVKVREADGKTLETNTRSEAWLLGGHTAVVQVDGRAGCFALSHVNPVLP